MERMEAGRNTAAAKRHKGLVTGKSAAGWGPRKAAPVDHDCPHVQREKVLVAWHMAKGAAHEIYERLVFPERYCAGTIDDVIAARNDAERDDLLATF